MLSASVCGDVFASPSAAQILAAIRLCAGRRGALLIVTVAAFVYNCLRHPFDDEIIARITLVIGCNLGGRASAPRPRATMSIWWWWAKTVRCRRSGRVVVRAGAV